MKYPTVIGMSNSWTIFLYGMVMFFSNIQAPQAQRPAKNIGIGFQAGNPTGLSIQFHKSQGVTTDILLAYHFNNFFFLHIHGLWYTPLEDKGHLRLYYGPGGFAGMHRRESNYPDDEVVVGISGNLGLSLTVSRLEFFGQITPRLEVIPGTDLDIGGGVGLRFLL